MKIEKRDCDVFADASDVSQKLRVPNSICVLINFILQSIIRNEFQYDQYQEILNEIQAPAAQVHNRS